MGLGDERVRLEEAGIAALLRTSLLVGTEGRGGNRCPNINLAG